MKKLFITATFLSLAFVACKNESGETTTTEQQQDSIVAVDSTAINEDSVIANAKAKVEEAKLKLEEAIKSGNKEAEVEAKKL